MRTYTSKSDFISSVVAHLKETSRRHSSPFWPFSEGRHEIVFFFNHFSIAQCCADQITIPESAIVFADGALLARQVSDAGIVVRRTSFDLTSIAAPWIQRALDTNMAILFVGGTAGDSSRFESWLQGLAHEKRGGIVCKDGYASIDLEACLRRLRDRHSSVFIVFGTGSPRQEQQALKAQAIASSLFDSSVTTTCGGFITQTANSLLDGNDANFYPNWIKKYGLRWLYRCYAQPYVIGRIIKIYPIMYFRVLLRRKVVKKHEWREGS